LSKFLKQGLLFHKSSLKELYKLMSLSILLEHASYLIESDELTLAPTLEMYFETAEQRIPVLSASSNLKG
jgi:hypothetical protein